MKPNTHYRSRCFLILLLGFFQLLLNPAPAFASGRAGEITIATEDAPLPTGEEVGGFNSDAFITKWTLEANETLTIFSGNEGAMKFDIDWGDNSSDLNHAGFATHTYTNAGTYTIQVTGELHKIHFQLKDAGGNVVTDMMTTVEQWGTIKWGSLEDAFANYKSLVISATDMPDLSQTSTMAGAFRGIDSFTGDISNWDVSNVQNMSALFENAIDFNGDISGWNVSSVTDMSSIFSGAADFNGDISSWDVSAVTNMSEMFQNDSSFNANISGWDVSALTNMERMFNRAIDFNQDLSSWDVSKVTSMKSAFEFALSFTGVGLENWDVSAVTTMERMFFHHATFNGDVTGWNVANVTNMKEMFSDNEQFNQNIGGWDVSNVTDMSSMFQGASLFNQDIGSWDVSRVTSMSAMFTGASAFNQDITNWDVGNVTSFFFMFTAAIAFNQPLDSWDVSSATNMGAFFANADAFDQDLNSWDVSSVTNMQNMFSGADIFNGDISAWDMSGVTNMAGMFHMARKFNRDIGQWDTGSAEDMRFLFASATDFNQDIGDWDVSQAQEMDMMFQFALDFNQDIGDWNVGSALDMNAMFWGAVDFNQDLGDWDVSKVTDMSLMFKSARDFNRDISQWDVSSVTTMEEMFNMAGLSSINYDLLLEQWSQLSLQNNVVFGAETLHYCQASADRQKLINDFGWTITDLGQQCVPHLISGVKDSDTQITLTYNENVQTQGGNPTDFKVTDALGNNFTVTAQADGVAGDAKIVLTVSNLITAVGDLTVTYKNSHDQISDAATGQNPSPTNSTGVFIDADVTAPAVTHAEASGNTAIILEFDEPVQVIGSNPGDFTVKDAANTDYAVTAIEDGNPGDNKLLLTVADFSGRSGDLTISYVDNNQEVEDFGDNVLAGFSNEPVSLDVTAPSGYTVSFADDLIGGTELLNTRITVPGAEIGTTFNYAISSSGGGADVTGTGVINAADQQITVNDLSGLGDGTLTISLTLTDLAGNEGVAATDTAEKDSTAPVITALSPEDDSPSASIASNLVITFSKNVVKNNGSVTIKKKSDDSVIETITVSSSSVSVDDNEVTIEPSAFLPQLTEVYVIISSVAFKDEAGNLFAGISNSTDWDFTTGGPVATITDMTFPQAGAYGIGDHLDFVVTFSEAIDASGSPGLPMFVNTISNQVQFFPQPDGGAVVEATLLNDVTNSTTATFRYTVKELDLDLDGIQLADEFNLNGGSVVKTGTTEAVRLKIASMQQINAVIIDGVKPVIPALAFMTEDTNNSSDLVTSDNTPLFVALPIQVPPLPFNSNDFLHFKDDVYEFFLDEVSIGSVSASEFAGGGGIGAWQLDLANQPLQDGTYIMNINATDSLGNTRTFNDIVMGFVLKDVLSFAITIDTSAPLAPEVTGISTDGGSSESDGHTSDNTLVFGGTAEANAAVELFIDGTSAGSTTADENGNWSFDHTGTELTEGNYDITAIASDLAGNTSPESSAFSVSIDTTVPTVVISSSELDESTATFTLTFTFSEDITDFGLDDITVNGGMAANLNAQSNSVFTCTISSSGGNVTAELESDKVSDDAGNGNSASNQVALIFDDTPPLAPVVTGVSSDSGTDTADGLTNDNTLIISGTAEANSTVEVFLDASSIGTTTTDGNGDWSLDYTGTSLADGSYNITAKATDVAENTGPESSAFTVTIDTASPTVILTNGALDLASASYTVTFTFSEAITGFSLDDISVTGGTASSLNVQSNSVFTCLVNSSGGSASVQLLADKVLDNAGNGNSASNTLELVFDNTPPDAPMVTGISTDSGSDATDGLTNDNTLTFNGTAEENSTVEVFEDGTSIGTVNADANGDWSLDHTATTLSDGSYDITAKATDAAGNTSEESNALTVQIDTNAPEINSIIRISPTTNLVNTSLVTYQMTFSEAVVNVQNTDFEVISGLGVTATIGELTEISSTVYQLVVSGVSGNGLLRIRSLSNTDIADGAGNLLSNQTESEEAFNFDSEGPVTTISSIATSPFPDHIIPVDICFDKPVTGFDISDITVNRGTLGSLSQSASVSHALTWGGLGTNTGQFNNPRRVTVDAAGNVLVTDRENNRIQRFDQQGNFVDEVGEAGTGPGQFDRPFATEVDPLGNVYVLDANNYRVQVFDHTLTFLYEFGSNGNGDGQFMSAGEFVIDDEGRVFVADWIRKDIQVFDRFGTFLFSFDNGADSGLGFIGGMDFDDEGRLFASDWGLDKVLVFDGNGTFQFEFGSSGFNPGQFTNPFDLVVSGGYVFVAEGTWNRVDYFDLSGTYIGSLDPVSSGGVAFSKPGSLVVSEDFELYVASLSNHHIQKFNLKSCYSTTVTVDSGGAITVDVTQAVAQDDFGNDNEAATQLSILINNVPEDISLSATSILENNAIGDLVANLSTVDADAADTHTYTLVSGVGDDHNAAFQITGTMLEAAKVFDRETQDSYNIRIRATDDHGSSYEEQFTITIDNVPEAELRITGDPDIPATAINIPSTFHITMHNDGDAILVISSILYPTAFGGPVSGISVAPGGSEQVAMTFTPAAAQTYSGDITILSNGGTGIISVTADGAVITNTDDGLVSAETIKLYPNPADKLINVDLSPFNGMPVTLNMYDMNGLITFDLKDYNKPSIDIDVTAYQQGIYLLLLTDGNQKIQKKVMIKR